jgi:ribose-phosphate pyrophosphokinase
MICALPGNEAFGERLRAELGTQSVALEWRYFPDGESYLQFRQEFRGQALAIVCTLNDPDRKTLPLLFAARTARELGAVRVGLVAPYLGYMRQDRRFHEGEAVTSVHFAALLSQAFDWLVTVDPHLHRRGSLAGIYPIPNRVVAAAPAIAQWISANVAKPLVVGPDSESEQWAAEVAAACGAPHAVMSKTRLGDRRVEIEAPPLSQWQDRTPVLLDDIISSARTMALAATKIRQAGLGRSAWACTASSRPTRSAPCATRASGKS